MDDSIIDLGHERKRVRSGPPPEALPSIPEPAEQLQPLQGEAHAEHPLPLQDVDPAISVQGSGNGENENADVKETDGAIWSVGRY